MGEEGGCAFQWRNPLAWEGGGTHCLAVLSQTAHPVWFPVPGEQSKISPPNSSSAKGPHPPRGAGGGGEGQWPA